MQVNFILIESSTLQHLRKQRILTPDLFEKILHYLVREILARKKKQPIMTNIGKLRIIDSSTMIICLSPYPWGALRKTKAGIRLSFECSGHERQDYTRYQVPDSVNLIFKNVKFF